MNAKKKKKKLNQRNLVRIRIPCIVAHCTTTKIFCKHFSIYILYIKFIITIIINIKCREKKEYIHTKPIYQLIPLTVNSYKITINKIICICVRSIDSKNWKCNKNEMLVFPLFLFLFLSRKNNCTQKMFWTDFFQIAIFALILVML